MTFRLFFTIIFALVAIGCFVASRITHNEDDRDILTKVSLVGVAATVGFFVLSMIRIVSPGHVGIPVTFGSVGGQLGPGFHLTNPFATLEELSIRTENYTMSGSIGEGAKQGNDAVTVLGKYGVTADVDSSVLFHLQEADASRTYRETGSDYVEKVLRSTARTCVRDEFAKFDMVDGATSHREDISVAITGCIEREVSPKGIAIETFQLREVHLGADVQNSINAKLTAQQEAQRQIFQLSTTQQQAEIARVDAQGKADAQQIIKCGGQTVSAEGGTTKVIPRTGDACINSLSAEYLQYLYIQSLTAMVNSPNHSTLILPFDQQLTPLLNITPNG